MGLPDGYLRGCRVLELGAGCGLPGLIAWLLGASVWLTDLPDILHITKQNAVAARDAVICCGDHPACKGTHLNEHEPVLEVCPYIWGDNLRTIGSSRGEFDLVIASDIVYDLEGFPLLARTLRQAVGALPPNMMFSASNRAAARRSSLKVRSRGHARRRQRPHWRRRQAESTCGGAGGRARVLMAFEHRWGDVTDLFLHSLRAAGLRVAPVSSPPLTLPPPLAASGSSSAPPAGCGGAGVGADAAAPAGPPTEERRVLEAAGGARRMVLVEVLAQEAGGCHGEGAGVWDA